MQYDGYTVSKRFLRSFGAVNILFDFLEVIEVLKLQALDHYTYGTCVGRSQIKLSLHLDRLIFSQTWNENFNQSIFRIQPRHQQNRNHYVA